MREAQLCSEVVKSLRDAGAWAYKIPDAPHLPAGDGKPRFTPAKPFDVAAVVEGTAVAVEVKLKRNAGGLSRKQFTDFELSSLAAFAEAGGSALVAVGYRATLGPLNQKRLGTTYLRELYLLDAAHLLAAEKPVSRAMMREVGAEAAWLGSGRWDVAGAIRGLSTGGKDHAEGTTASRVQGGRPALETSG